MRHERRLIFEKHSTYLASTCGLCRHDGRSRLRISDGGLALRYHSCLNFSEAQVCARQAALKGLTASASRLQCLTAVCHNQ